MIEMEKSNRLEIQRGLESLSSMPRFCMGRRQLIPTSCPLTCIRMLWHICLSENKQMGAIFKRIQLLNILWSVRKILHRCYLTKRFKNVFFQKAIVINKPLTRKETFNNILKINLSISLFISFNIFCQKYHRLPHVTTKNSCLKDSFIVLYPLIQSTQWCSCDIHFSIAFIKQKSLYFCHLIKFSFVI